MGGLSLLRVLSRCFSVHRLQHVRRGHWDLALRVLEHGEVEPRAQVRVGPCWWTSGTSGPLVNPRALATQQVYFWAFPLRIN